MIGRFLQADSVIMPQSTFGMNRYMYVEGNPVKYGDYSGHDLTTSQAWTLVGYMHWRNQGLSHEDSLGYATIGAGVGRRETIKQKRANSFIGRNDNTLPLPGWPFMSGKISEAYRSTFTKDRDKGLDSHIKMAAIGYMVKGAEGAFWGYILGLQDNEHKKRERIDNRYRDIGRGLAVIGFIVEWKVALAFLSEDIAESVGFAIETGLGKYSGSLENSEVPNFVCKSAFAMSLTNPKSDYERGGKDFAYGLCLFSISARGK